MVECKKCGHLGLRVKRRKNGENYNRYAHRVTQDNRYARFIVKGLFA